MYCHLQDFIDQKALTSLSTLSGLCNLKPFSLFPWQYVKVSTDLFHHKQCRPILYRGKTLSNGRHEISAFLAHYRGSFGRNVNSELRRRLIPRRNEFRGCIYVEECRKSAKSAKKCEKISPSKWSRQWSKGASNAKDSTAIDEFYHSACNWCWSCHLSHHARAWQQRRALS